MRQKNALTLPATEETSIKIAAKCVPKTATSPTTEPISIATTVTSVTTAAVFAMIAVMFARIGAISGTTATTETKLTRVGEGGEDSRRLFILLGRLEMSFVDERN